MSTDNSRCLSDLITPPGAEAIHDTEMSPLPRCQMCFKQVTMAFLPSCDYICTECAEEGLQ